LDEHKPGNKFKTDKQRKAACIKMGIELQKDETGEEGVCVKKGPKTIRTGKRMAAKLVKHQEHENKDEAKEALVKNGQGLQVKDNTQDWQLVISLMHFLFVC
jgi:hypothetical protein